MLDRDKICRVCLESGPRLVQLFATQPNTEVSLADIISQCTNSCLCREDELPQLICNKCTERARSAFNFIKLYEASQRTLNELLTKVKKNTEQEFKPSIADYQELLKTEEFDAIKPSEQLAQSDYKDIVETKVYEAIEPKGRAELISAHLETSSGTEEDSRIIRTECAQEEELLIKEENTTDMDTYAGIMDSNVTFQVNSGNNVCFFEAVTDTTCRPSCSTDGDQNLLKDKTKSDKAGASKYHIQNLNNCWVCGRNFSQKKTFKNHMLTEHNEEKPFKCQNCNKSFGTPEKLKTHQRLHTGEKPYKCPVCHVCFARADGLTAHKRSHTGEKPYKCQDCDKSYAGLTHFKAHRRTHTNEKPY